MSDLCLKFLTVGTDMAARQIAVRRREGGSPGLFWLGGFKSDMRGTKAEALDRWAPENGRAMTRFDYSGHGESGGNFTDRSIGRWLEESLAVLDTFCRGLQVVIGSSMGGWLALLLIRELARRRQADPSVARLVLIAPAVDFTEELMWKRFPQEVKLKIEQTGVWARPYRGGAQAPPARRHDRDRLPGADSSGRAGSRRSMAAHGRADLSLCPRRRRADADKGWRPSSVAPGGYRAADCRRGGV